MLITLYLITSNVYGSVEAPKSRGFSYIEVWMVGIQATILLAIFEYVIILVLKRRMKGKNGVTQVQGANQVKQAPPPPQKIEAMVKTMDELTTLGSALFFITFNVCYWLAANLK